MFFPKGSQWDAFVVIRDVFHRAQQSITIVDPYANGTIFQLLARDGGVPLRVRVLCSKYAAAVAAEATTFSAQHPGTTVEVRSTRKEFHDRFIMVDEDEYVHLGASIKDAGNTAFMISAIEDETNKVALVSAFNNAWEAAQVVT